MNAERKCYMAWSRDFYESEFRMSPHPHEVHGPFAAIDEADLIAQIKAQGIDPKSVRWEEVIGDSE